MSTQIKRLFQQNTEFVPITLAEAVVVNTNDTNLPPLGITTLDKVLQGTLLFVGNNTQNINTINQTVANINKALLNKQDKITWGEGIEIGEDGSINVVTTNKIDLYKIVTALPPASIDCENTIYLLPSSENVSGNVWKEFICVYSDSLKIYVWEEIGTVQTDVDLSGYVTRTEYSAAINSINTQINDITTELGNKLTAQSVTYSTGGIVEVNYEIPSNLYDTYEYTY